MKPAPRSSAASRTAGPWARARRGDHGHGHGEATTGWDGRQRRRRIWGWDGGGAMSIWGFWARDVDLGK